MSPRLPGWYSGTHDAPPATAAVAAHADRVFVSLEGTVHRVGRSWRMDGVSRLRVEAQREFEGPRLGLNPPDEG